MATPHACAALVDVFPSLLRARRSLAGTLSTPSVVTLAVVHQRGTMRVSEVADALALDLSTVSRQVTHLRRRGLLESAPDPEDGRSQRLHVTRAGTDELRTHRRRVVDKLVENLRDWDDHEVVELTRLLGKLTATCATEPTTLATAPPRTTTDVQEKQLQGNS